MYLHFTKAHVLKPGLHVRRFALPSQSCRISSVLKGLGLGLGLLLPIKSLKRSEDTNVFGILHLSPTHVLWVCFSAELTQTPHWLATNLRDIMGQIWMGIEWVWVCIYSVIVSLCQLTRTRGGLSADDSPLTCSSKCQPKGHHLCQWAHFHTHLRVTITITSLNGFKKRWTVPNRDWIALKGCAQLGF